PLDDLHFAFYLLDTSGHGVGSCLLSVSVGDMLRRHILPDVDFHKPVQVLEALSNHAPRKRSCAQRCFYAD
ncbi:MAG: regulator, partial [Planctomycetota bacterium]